MSIFDMPEEVIWEMSLDLDNDFDEAPVQYTKAQRDRRKMNNLKPKQEHELEFNKSMNKKRERA